ncbi:MAG: AsmA-like C-terminal region-containing protein, partial [Acidobacteriaceae bacterium]
LMTAGGNFGLLENGFADAAPRGLATLDTTTAGRWMPPLAGGTSGIATSGALTVGNVELRPKFLRAPLEVQSAHVDLTPDAVAWKDAAFRYQGMALEGDVTFPVTCTAPGGCPASFALSAGTLNAAALATMVRGSERGFLGQLFSLGGASPAPWPAAQGTVSCDALDLGRLAIGKAQAELTVEGGKLTIESLTGKALGGTLEANGTMTMAAGVPQWKVDARLNSAKMNEAGALFRETWAGGTASGQATLTLRGASAADLASSASGDFSFTWQNGGLAASRPAQEPLAHFDRWSAKGTVANSLLTLTTSEVSRGAAGTAVEGTIGFDRSVHLTLHRRAGSLKVAGSLAHPAAP